MRILAACLVVGVAGVVGCATAERAAARDPMKCERDPSCARGRGSYADCTRQCADAPECMQRCEQIQHTTDSLGH